MTIQWIVGSQKTIIQFKKAQWGGNCVHMAHRTVWQERRHQNSHFLNEFIFLFQAPSGAWSHRCSCSKLFHDVWEYSHVNQVQEMETFQALIIITFIFLCHFENFLLKILNEYYSILNTSAIKKSEFARFYLKIKIPFLNLISLQLIFLRVKFWFT